jgi:hypothetical protein
VKIVNKLFIVYATEEQVANPAMEDSINKIEKGKTGNRLGQRRKENKEEWRTFCN